MKKFWKIVGNIIAYTFIILFFGAIFYNMVTNPSSDESTHPECDWQFADC